MLIDQNGSYCFVVNNDNTVSVKRISTEQENGQNIVVKSGIALGDKVVLSSDRLQAGMKVDAEITP